MDLARHGVLEKYGVEMIGANAAVIAKAEERDQFRLAMERIGLDVCRGQTVHSLEEARQVVERPGCRASSGRASPSAARARTSPTAATSSTSWSATA